MAFFPVFSMMHPTQLFICTGHTQKTKTKISQSFKKCLKIVKLIFILMFTHDFWRKNSNLFLQKKTNQQKKITKLRYLLRENSNIL